MGCDQGGLAFLRRSGGRCTQRRRILNGTWTLKRKYCCYRETQVYCELVRIRLLGKTVGGISEGRVR
jgi:hypothetical protein